MTNGLTNGVTNGVTNGRRFGLINGSLGKTNGITNGFVNGAGAVNGFRLSYQQRHVKSSRIEMRKKVVMITVIVALLIAVPYVLVFKFPKSTVEIDGYFMDWLTATIYRESPDSWNPDIALVAYAMKYDVMGAYFYLKTDGSLFQGQDDGADGFYIFVDRDGRSTTGYSVRGMGADSLITVVGWDSSVAEAYVSHFNNSRSNLDFNGFVPSTEAKVAFYNNELELSGQVNVGQRTKVAIYARHSGTASDWSDVSFNAKGPAIEIVQDYDAPSILPRTYDQHVLSLNISSKGSSTAVAGLNFDYIGNATPTYVRVVEGRDLIGFSVSKEVTFNNPLAIDEIPRSIRVSVDLPSDSDAWSFGLRLNRTNPFTLFGNATWTINEMQTGSMISYIVTTPWQIVIDGAFDDWYWRAPIHDLLCDAYSNDSRNCKSGDIDIDTVKTASSPTVASFYMSVNGTMLGGSSVPSDLVRFVTPGEPAGDIVEIPQNANGSDFAFVFIDADLNYTTGYEVGGSEISIAVLGKGNTILSSRIYQFIQGEWVDSGPTSAAIDLYQIEIGANYSDLGLSPTTRYPITFLTQDWSGRKDDISILMPARLTASADAFGGILMNEIWSQKNYKDWIELYNTGTTPISIQGWTLVVDGVVVYTFPSITLQPGEFYVTGNLDFGYGTNYELKDLAGDIIDAVTIPFWMEKTFGRTGDPPYSAWAEMSPSKGKLNNGQVAIPEFETLIVPLAIIPIMLIAIRLRRKSPEAQGDSEVSRMPDGERRRSGSTTFNGQWISSILRSFSEPSETEKPFVPLVGGSRLFVLLLYAAVVVAASVEFFVGMRIWYGSSWDIYNSFVFILTGVFVFVGMLMLFSAQRKDPDDWKIPISRPKLSAIGFLMFALSGIVLAAAGKSVGGWAIALSVTLLYGFLFMVLSSKGVTTREGLNLMVFGTGLILMILVPVHEAFGYAKSPPGDIFLFTLPNIVLLIGGMLIALYAIISFVSRDAFVGAWLMGAMAIFLIAFHEQFNIVSTKTFSDYDRTLALVGITFSFLPLVMYVWRERVYIFLWRRLRSANVSIQTGNYATALEQIDFSIRLCSRMGIEDKFALPWSLRADTLYRMKSYDKALYNYDTALGIEPRDTVSWTHVGNIYSFQKKNELALKAFENALRIDPKNVYAWNNRGTIYQSLRMYDDALICFDKAIRNSPRNFDAEINMAKLLSKVGHSNESLLHYQQALAIKPDSEDAKAGVHREFFRGQCLDQINGWEHMGLDTTYLKRLLEEDPVNFVRKSKEWLVDLVEHKSDLPVLPEKEHIDVNAVIQKILKISEGSGATIEMIEEETNLRRRDLVLPLAILTETEKIHFKSDGRSGMYVSKGKPPERPPEPPPLPPEFVPSVEPVIPEEVFEDIPTFVPLEVTDEDLHEILPFQSAEPFVPLEEPSSEVPVDAHEAIDSSSESPNVVPFEPAAESAPLPEKIVEPAPEVLSMLRPKDQRRQQKERRKQERQIKKAVDKAAKKQTKRSEAHPERVAPEKPPKREPKKEEKAEHKKEPKKPLIPTVRKRRIVTDEPQASILFFRRKK
jgi:tetratricopeptide (TPR) repeat protein